MKFSDPSLGKSSFKLTEITIVHLRKSYFQLTFVNHKFPVTVGYKVSIVNIHVLKIIARIYHTFERFHDSYYTLFFCGAGWGGLEG